MAPHPTKDKTLIELESDASQFEVNTLYRSVRSIEGRGFCDIKLSYATMTRPENRTPGEPDDY